MTLAIGIDIGGGSTKIGLVSGDGQLRASRRVVPEHGAGFQGIAALYAVAIADLLGSHTALPIGVAYPGHIDRAAGLGFNSNVPALDGEPLCAWLVARFGGPTALLNDADAAAVAESARHAEARMLMVTLGTGIGVAMVVGGVPVVTAGGTLGDSGHLNLDPAGRYRCRQGCKGCLESLVSAEALARDATDLARTGASPALVAELAKSGEVSAAALCQLALAGDPAAQGLVDAMTDWLAMAVASWRATFHPDIIVIGGGLSVLGSDFVTVLQTKADARSLPFLAAPSRLALAELGNDAGMIGAGLAALKTATTGD